MAYSNALMKLLGPDDNSGTTRFFVYGPSSADTLATIAASGYFNTWTLDLAVGDIIHCTGSDGEQWRRVTASGKAAANPSTAVTTEAQDGVSGSGSTVVRHVKINDVSTAQSAYFVADVAGTLSGIKTVINGAIATADAVITAEINGTAVTDSAVTIANSGSAAGDVDTSTPSAANTVAVDDVLEVITDGASTNTVTADVFLTITRA